MKRWQTLFESLLFFLMIILIREITYYGYGFYYLVISPMHSETSLDYITTYQLYMNVVTWVVIAIVIMLIAAFLKLPFRQTFSLRFSSVNNALVAVLCGFGLVLVVNGITNSIAVALNLRFNIMESEGLMGYSLPMLILLAGIVVPFFEELMYRGFLLTRLSETCKPSISILLVALMFSIGHFNILQGIYIFPVGIMTAFLVIKSRSIWSAILVHIVFNVTNIYVYNIGLFSYNLSQMLVLSVIGLVLIGFSLYQFQ